MKIALIGMMGSGKTSVGAALSMMCTKAPLYDTDAMICQLLGRSVVEIFAEQGEAEFRRVEAQVLHQFISRQLPQYILSTGGGIVLHPENAQLLRSECYTVWLRADPITIVERLQTDDSRPLLHGDNLQHNLQQLDHARRQIYSNVAHQIIDVDAMSVEQIAQEILDSYVENVC